MNMMKKKFKKKNTDLKRDFFMHFILEWAKNISSWNCWSDNYNLWNQKLSYLNQLQWIIVTWI
jgi:hypothetical protein